MIERAIENWLTNTNERNYQIPYCQVLAHQGHKILYISKHGQLEQGKDIITIAPDGSICGYQLKTGNINLREWRQIAGEIQELVEIPIVHASVPTGTIHKSYLVCNGNVDDTVRLQITQRNQDNIAKNRNYSFLETIECSNLVSQFVDASGAFLPQDLTDFKLFLDLFNYDGRSFLPKDKFNKFLQDSVFRKPQKQRAASIHCVSSCILVTSYILKSFQDCKNHFALFEAWTLLKGGIIRFAAINNLKDKEIEASIALVDQITNDCLDELTKEAYGRKYLLEGDVRGDGGPMINMRRTIVVGAVCAHQVTQMCSDSYFRPSETVQNFIDVNSSNLSIWGEGCFPFFLNLIHYNELLGNSVKSQSLLREYYSAVLSSNHINSDISLPSPYDSPGDVLAALSGLDRHRVDFNNLKGRSYMLASLIEMLARRNLRELVEQGWKWVTTISLEEARFYEEYEYFSWKSEEAINHSTFLNPTGSWSAIQKESVNLKPVPTAWINRGQFVRFWTMVCPQRVNVKTTRILDLEVQKAMEVRGN